MKLLDRINYLGNRPKLYLDCCCFNRPFDDLSQESMKEEADAVLEIIDSIEEGKYQLLKSFALDEEVDKSPDKVKKQDVMKLYNRGAIDAIWHPGIDDRADSLKQILFSSFDALHLAIAEHYSATALITVDKKFISRARDTDSKIRVMNPVDWIKEESSMKKWPMLIKERATAYMPELKLSSQIRQIQKERPGTGNYTEERHEWLKDVTIEEIVAAARKREQS